MTCGFSRVTTRTIFMLCIMQNFRYIILSAIASAATDIARQYISQNDSDSFIKFINKLHVVINIGKIVNDARLFRFQNLLIIRDQWNICHRISRANGYHLKALPFFIIRLLSWVENTSNLNSMYPPQSLMMLGTRGAQQRQQIVLSTTKAWERSMLNLLNRRPPPGRRNEYHLALLMTCFTQSSFG